MNGFEKRPYAQWCTGWTTRYGNPINLSRVHLRDLAEPYRTLCGQTIGRPSLQFYATAKDWADDACKHCIRKDGA